MSEQDLLPRSGPPKKSFLKKGEGLKRFAAYKPPLPVASHKTHRRETFVKFKENCQYIPPELLYDDSINLSTEIPKIAPPKIMHTPMRPNRQALGFVKTVSTQNTQEPPPPRRYNLRGGRKQATENEPQKGVRRRYKAVIEKCTPQADVSAEMTNLLKKIEEKKNSLEDDKASSADDKTSLDGDKEISDISDGERVHETPLGLKPIYDLSTPSPGHSILALGEHIKQIESTVNELKEKIKSGADLSTPKKTRKTLRSNSKARPSAYADNNPTPRIVTSLMNEVAQLKEKIDVLSLRR